MSEPTRILLDLIPPGSESAALEIGVTLPLYPGSIACDEQTIAAVLHGDPLPYESCTFDLLICHDLLHRATRIDRMVAEYARVLKPGGQIGLIEPVTPGEPAVARFINDLEHVRSTTHQWTGSIDDLLTYLSLAAIEKTFDQVLSVRMDFNSWLTNSDLASNDVARIKAALLAAPEKPAEWLEVEQTSHRITLMCYTAVITGRKSIATS